VASWIYVRRVTFGPRVRVDARSGRLRIVQSGQPPRTIAYRYMARADDWDAMAAMLTARNRDVSRLGRSAGSSSQGEE
jgi:hypothetical protein